MEVWGRCIHQVWAAEGADLDLTVLDQGECDGVLVAAQESFRPVDRVEHPKARREFGAATVDPGADLVGGSGPGGAGDEADDCRKGVLCARGFQGGGGFLGDERVIRKVVDQQAGDQRLGGEVGDGDRRAVVLGDGGQDQLGLDVADEKCGLADSLDEEGDFGGVEIEHQGRHFLYENCCFRQ